MEVFGIDMVAVLQKIHPLLFAEEGVSFEVLGLLPGVLLTKQLHAAVDDEITVIYRRARGVQHCPFWHADRDDLLHYFADHGLYLLKFPDVL